jgi:hypothetical protein
LFYLQHLKSQNGTHNINNGVNSAYLVEMDFLQDDIMDAGLDLRQAPEMVRLSFLTFSESCPESIIRSISASVRRG